MYIFTYMYTIFIYSCGIVYISTVSSDHNCLPQPPYLLDPISSFLFTSSFSAHWVWGDLPICSWECLQVKLRLSIGTTPLKNIKGLALKQEIIWEFVCMILSFLFSILGESVFNTSSGDHNASIPEGTIKMLALQWASNFHYFSAWNLTLKTIWRCFIITHYK